MGEIFGLSDFHSDLPACLLVNVRLVAAVQEERFRWIKRWAGFPRHAVAYCLESAGPSLGDFSGTFYYSDPKANLFGKIAFVLIHRPEFLIPRIWSFCWDPPGPPTTRSRSAIAILPVLYRPSTSRHSLPCCAVCIASIAWMPSLWPAGAR